MTEDHLLPDTVVKEICETSGHHLVIANTGTGEGKKSAGHRYLLSQSV